MLVSVIVVVVCFPVMGVEICGCCLESGGSRGGGHGVFMRHTVHPADEPHIGGDVRTSECQMGLNTRWIEFFSSGSFVSCAFPGAQTFLNTYSNLRYRVIDTEFICAELGLGN